MLKQLKYVFPRKCSKHKVVYYSTKHILSHLFLKRTENIPIHNYIQ